LKINKQILERMIRDEMRFLHEGTAAEHADVMRDPAAFAGGLQSDDPKLREFFFFPIILIGKSEGSMFLKNLLIVHFQPALLQKIKENLLQALQDAGFPSGLRLSDTHLVRTKDQQYWMRIGYNNIWQKIPGSAPPRFKPNTRTVLYRHLTNLKWDVKQDVPGEGEQYKYVVGMKDLGPGKLKQPTVKRTKPVKIPGKKPRQSSVGRLGKGVLDAFGGAKALAGLGK